MGLDCLGLAKKYALTANNPVLLLRNKARIMDDCVCGQLGRSFQSTDRLRL